jgi:tetratricopeptide (TPR) repeat protein
MGNMRRLITLGTFLVAVCGIAAAEEDVKLASIVEMTKYLDSSGNLTPEPVVEAPVAPVTAPVDVAPVAPTPAAPAAPELPPMEYKEKKLEQWIAGKFDILSGQTGALVQSRVNEQVADLLAHNDGLGAARMVYRYGDFRRAYGAYSEVLRQEGQTKKERDFIAAGIAGVESLRPLIIQGRLEEAKNKMPTLMGKARTNTAQPVIDFCDDTAQMFDLAGKLFLFLAKLDKAAVQAPADEAAARKEAARLIASANLFAGSDPWRFYLITDPAIDKFAKPQNTPKALTDWITVYTELNIIVNTDAFLKYKDAEPFAEDLKAVGGALNDPFRLAQYLTLLITRFPGHQVVQSGEAFLRLADTLADIEAYQSAADVCRIAGNIAPDSAPVKQGEMTYLLAEALFKGKRYRDAIGFYQMLIATNKDHRAVLKGNAYARIAECNQKKDLVK